MNLTMNFINYTLRERKYEVLHRFLSTTAKPTYLLRQLRTKLTTTSNLQFFTISHHNYTS